MDITVRSINICGKAEILIADHQSAKTAYLKKPIEKGAVYLTMTGFDGDTVHDTKHHGGNDKAVCCYNADRFSYWQDLLSIPMETGAFGENLTLSGEEANEEHIFIGDRYQLGEAIVEVSEPRGPCYVIGIRHNLKKFPLLCQQTGFTGFYFRTIKEGMVKSGDTLRHISSHPEKISVMHVNQIRYHDFKNKKELERLIALKVLTPEWREKFTLLLAKSK